jgi:hypothetical protein
MYWILDGVMILEISIGDIQKKSALAIILHRLV